MAEILLFFAVAGLTLWLFLMRGEVAYLKRRVGELEQGLPLRAKPEAEPPREIVEPFKVAAKTRKTASVVRTEVPATATAPADEPPPEPERQFKNPLAGASFEDLIGGKLPIWIGGIALVFAGFFLVRYTIEAGLLGPGARSILATIFALLLIALSEFGGRLPKLGESFTADPRVGQSLAGAGVATLYGTLYMASEIYGLVGVGTAFLLVIVTTAIAFALSLRHGPPTALMGLAGGFAAPWVAGMGAQNLPTLLLYLAVFIAALFGLAVWRRWLWLLVLASGGGAVWSFAMLLTAETGLHFLCLFVLITAAAAMFALERFGETDGRWKQLAAYAPMALALVQLAMLLPQMEFSILAWGFYGTLAVLAMALAWRQAKMTLVMLAAVLLTISPLSLTWAERGADATTLFATFGVLLIFAGSGHLALQREKQPPLPWVITALGAPLVALLAASFADPTPYGERIWGAAALLTSAVSAWLAWQQHRAGNTGIVQRLATAATVLTLMVAGGALAEKDWLSSWCALVAVACAAWAKVTDDRVVRGTTIAPLGITMIWTVGASFQLIEAQLAALAGERGVFDMLPGIGETARATLLPAVFIGALGFGKWFGVGGKTKAVALAFAAIAITGFIWLIAKQPSAIESPSDFIRLGFAERAIFTQALFAGGWLALSQSARRPEWPLLKALGWALAGVALFRVVWFDLGLLNPVLVAQAVGPIPVANLATGHFALVALWLWLISPHATAPLMPRVLSLGAMILTALATVRQAVQGSILSGGYVDTGENYLYSAALLALAIGWLTRGMMAGSRLLRLAGLALLTVVTLKVFLIDAAALTGVLRILSFLGLGIALIGIGWAYGRVMGTAKIQMDS